MAVTEREVVVSSAIRSLLARPIVPGELKASVDAISAADQAEKYALAARDAALATLYMLNQVASLAAEVHAASDAVRAQAEKTGAASQLAVEAARKVSTASAEIAKARREPLLGIEDATRRALEAASLATEAAQRADQVREIPLHVRWVKEPVNA